MVVWYWPNIFFLLFLVGPNQVRPTSKVNYFAKTWTITVHILHATKWLQTGRGEDYQGQWSWPWSRGWVDNSGGITTRNGGGVGGGGSGRKRRRKSAEERESEQRWLLMAERWLCGLPMVELVAKNLVVMTVVAGMV